MGDSGYPDENLNEFLENLDINDLGSFTAAAHVVPSGLDIDGLDIDGILGGFIPPGMSVSALPSGLNGMIDGGDFTVPPGGLADLDLSSINIAEMLGNLPPGMNLRQLWAAQMPNLDLENLKIDDVLRELGQDPAGVEMMLGEMYQPFASIATSLIKIVPDAVDCIPKAIPLLTEEGTQGDTSQTASSCKIAFASDLAVTTDEQAIQQIIMCMYEIQQKDGSCSRVVGRLMALNDPDGPMMEFVEKIMEKLDQIMGGLDAGAGGGAGLDLPDFMELKTALAVFKSEVDAFETAKGVQLGDQTVKAETEAAVSVAVETAKAVANAANPDDNDPNDAGAVGPLRYLIAGVLALVAAVTGFN